MASSHDHDHARGHEHAGHSHATLDEYPIAVLVHLSGPLRGSTQRLSGEFLTIGSSDDADVRIADADTARPPDIRGGLVCRGSTYEVVAEPGRKVWVNGTETEKAMLEPEDIIEMGRGGPLLRFRLYPPNSPAYKTVLEAFGDCVECARHAEPGMVRRGLSFAWDFPRELATQTSVAFRTTVALALIVLSVSTGLLARRSSDLEARLGEEMGRVAGLSELLARSQAQSLEGGELERLRAELDARIEEATGRLGALEAQTGDVSGIVAASTRATLFIQGSYGFRDPATGRRLRTRVDASGRAILNSAGHPALTLEGPGPFFEIPYTGTGFVVEAPSGQRVVITNRHVALPWEFDEAARSILSRGLEGAMVRFRAFVPGRSASVPVRVAAESDSADVAVLRADGLPRDVPALELADDAPVVGESVVVLGYPLGIRALVARAERPVVEELQSSGTTGFWAVADRLAQGGHIQPLVSGGIVGQVTGGAVVYDAETTSGGSGGPVLDRTGRVVAVNAAILPEFGGSNLGVPVRFLRRLLDGAIRP